MELKRGSLCQNAIRKRLQWTVQESSSNKYIPELFGSQTGNWSRKLWLVPRCAFSRFPMTPFCVSLLSPPPLLRSSPTLPPVLPFSATSNSLVAQGRSTTRLPTTASGSLLPPDPLVVTITPRAPACLCLLRGCELVSDCQYGYL